MSLPLFSSLLTLLVTLVALIWNALSPTNRIMELLGPQGVIGLVVLTLVFGAIAVIYRFWRRDEMLARSALACLVLPAFVAMSGVLTFMGAALQFPLVDASLARLDAALGLDWKAFAFWAAGQKWFTDYAVYLYGTPFWAIPAFLIFQAMATRDAERLEHIIAFTIVSCSLTTIIGSVLPASSVYAFHEIPQHIADQIGTVADASYAKFYAAMRAGEPVSLADAMHGTVTFPSFHTTVGVMGLLYVSARPNMLVAVPMYIVALGMIACTPLIGGHYFVDLIGGAVVALLSYRLVDFIAASGAREAGLSESATQYTRHPA